MDLSADTIIGCVCRYYGVEEQQLRSMQRSKAVAEPRQVAIFLLRHLTNLSLVEIGRAFNGDHTAVVHALQEVEALRNSDGSKMEDILRDIQRNIKNNV